MDESPVHVFASPGAYPVQLIVSYECVTDVFTDSVRIHENAIGEIYDTICVGGTVDFNGISYDASGVYPDIILDSAAQNGCDSLVTLFLEMKTCEGLIFPNAFTPNRDNTNDVFEPVNLEVVEVDEYTLIVYNRWGEKVFMSNDINVGWDGKCGSEDCPGDAYVWTLTYRIAGEIEINTDKGDVSLIR